MSRPCLLLLVAPAGASAKVFLELPGVPGESAVAGYEKQIELDSFQLGLSNPVQMGTTQVKGKPSFSEITVAKKLDKSPGVKEEVFTSGWDVIANLQLDACK